MLTSIIYRSRLDEIYLFVYSKFIQIPNFVDWFKSWTTQKADANRLFGVDDLHQGPLPLSLRCWRLRSVLTITAKHWLFIFESVSPCFSSFSHFLSTYLLDVFYVQNMFLPSIGFFFNMQVLNMQRLNMQGSIPTNTPSGVRSRRDLRRGANYPVARNRRLT